MDIQFINITSYADISINAEHYYATIGTPSFTQGNIMMCPRMDMAVGVSFNFGTKLKYYPTEEEARKLWQKDHGHDKDPLTLKWKEDMIKELQEDGTERFPSILEITKAARKHFPDSLLCFSIYGSQDRFAKYMMQMKDKEMADKILKSVFGKTTSNQ